MSKGQEICVIEGCQNQIDPGVAYYCERTEPSGPYCRHHFEELGCEENHPEDCETKRFI